MNKGLSWLVYGPVRAPGTETLGGAGTLKVVPRLPRTLATIAAAAMFILALAGGGASATVLAVNDAFTTNNGYTITVVACYVNGISGCPSGDTITLTGNSVTLTGGSTSATNGSAPGVFESATLGSVDTFIVFSVYSPLQSTSSVGISATGCGYGVTGAACASSPSQSADQATATLQANASASVNAGGTALNGATPYGPSGGVTGQIGANGQTTSTISVTDKFTSSVATYPSPGIYVGLNLNVNATGTTSYASLDSVSLSVPEPASGAVLAFALAGLGMLGRRRRSA